VNLSAAAEQTGFLKDRNLICEVYPAKVRDEHLKFLDGVGSPHIGVGLQSFDSEVLGEVERRYDEARFNNILTDLRSVARLAIEIILGLPGDSPEKFKMNFERARSLPYALRVYHCLVLPSALMKRSPKEHALDYDPVTLKMRSCLGWSRDGLAEAVDFVNQHAVRERGATGEFFWVFPRR
jgi:coproporphyrinogen III oxidase-like Fe-S oxidoreductase